MVIVHSMEQHNNTMLSLEGTSSGMWNWVGTEGETIIWSKWPNVPHVFRENIWGYFQRSFVCTGKVKSELCYMSRFAWMPFTSTNKVWEEILEDVGCSVCHPNVESKCIYIYICINIYIILFGKVRKRLLWEKQRLQGPLCQPCAWLVLMWRTAWPFVFWSILVTVYYCEETSWPRPLL